MGWDSERTHHLAVDAIFLGCLGEPGEESVDDAVSLRDVLDLPRNEGVPL